MERGLCDPSKYQYVPRHPERCSLLFLPSVLVNSSIFQIAFWRQLLNHTQEHSWEGEKRLPQAVLSSKGGLNWLSLLLLQRKLWVCRSSTPVHGSSLHLSKNYQFFIYSHCRCFNRYSLFPFAFVNSCACAVGNSFTVAQTALAPEESHAVPLCMNSACADESLLSLHLLEVSVPCGQLGPDSRVQRKSIFESIRALSKKQYSCFICRGRAWMPPRDCSWVCSLSHRLWMEDSFILSRMFHTSKYCIALERCVNGS